MRRFAIALILLALAAAPRPAAAQSLSEPQKKEIEALIGEYLRTHPEVILDSVRAMQEREQAMQQQRQREGLTTRRGELENDPTSPVVGNPNGDVTLVEFFDYRCGYCKAVLPAVQRLLKEDPKVRYVMKDLPILSPESRIAAKLTLAVWKSEPKRYFDLHTRLMESRGELSETRIYDIAKAVGVDVARAKRDMNSAEIEQALGANMSLAQALGITGTPGFVIGNHLVPGAIDYDALKELVGRVRRGS